MMRSQDLIREYQAEVARVGGPYEKWVYSKARDVDLNNSSERLIAEDLSCIMARFRFLYDWGGASSNNIHWNKTDVPLKVIQILKPRGFTYITLINPEIKELSGEPFELTEGCGSLPDMRFRVLRRPFGRVAGYVLEDQSVKPIELTYGSKNQYYCKQRLSSSGRWGQRLSALQHEYDHLKGRLLTHHATLIQE